MSIFKIELENLQAQMPHTVWHYVLFLPAGIAALIPLMFKLTRLDGLVVAIIAFLAIASFWMIQWRTLRVGVAAAQHNWRVSAPENLFGTVHPVNIIFSKFMAVLVHQLHWIVLSAIVMGGLALAVNGFLSRIPLIEQSFVMPDGSTTVGMSPAAEFYDTGVLRDYITYVVVNGDNLYTHLPHLGQLFIAGIALLIVNFSSAALSAALGLAFGSASRPLKATLIRVGIAFVALSMGLGFFTVRGTAMRDVYRHPASNHCITFNEAKGGIVDCDEIRLNTFALRIVESSEQVGFAFVDGGAFSSAMLVFPAWSYGEFLANQYLFFPYMLRHLLVLFTSSILHLILASAFLWWASIGFARKKKS